MFTASVLIVTHSSGKFTKKTIITLLYDAKTLVCHNKYGLNNVK